MQVDKIEKMKETGNNERWTNNEREGCPEAGEKRNIC